MLHFEGLLVPILQVSFRSGMARNAIMGKVLIINDGQPYKLSV
jgi:hypothetical protein